ncbi:hypothetical protein HBB16_01760 [Pseudonocardia sp. MCCB 268]|nr:hypothetical protein [Pseudonocardia cytotoxica]
MHAGPLEATVPASWPGSGPAQSLLGSSAGDDPGVLLHNARRLKLDPGPLAVTCWRWPTTCVTTRSACFPGRRARGDDVPRPRAAARRDRAQPGARRVADLAARCSACGQGRAGSRRARPGRRPQWPPGPGAGPAHRLPGGRGRRRVGDDGRAPGHTVRGRPAVMTVEGDLEVRDGAGGVLVESQTEDHGSGRPTCSARRSPRWRGVEPAVPADRECRGPEDRRAGRGRRRRRAAQAPPVRAGSTRSVPVGAVATEPVPPAAPDAHGESVSSS